MALYSESCSISKPIRHPPFDGLAKLSKLAILNAAFLDQGIGHEYKVPGPSGGEFQLREIRS
jgi:hypothetical protein